MRTNTGWKINFFFQPLIKHIKEGITITLHIGYKTFAKITCKNNTQRRLRTCKVKGNQSVKQIPNYDWASSHSLGMTGQGSCCEQLMGIHMHQVVAIFQKYILGVHCVAARVHEGLPEQVVSLVINIPSSNFSGVNF